MGAAAAAPPDPRARGGHGAAGAPMGPRGANPCLYFGSGLWTGVVGSPQYPRDRRGGV